MNARTERLNQITIFITLLVCFAYTFPRWADPNQNSRLNMIVAVVDDGTFQIDKYVENTVDYAKVGEHYFSDKAPGVAFLGIPVYAGLKIFLNLPVMDRVMEKLSNNAAFQATLKADGTGILKQKVRLAVTQVALAFLFAAVPTTLAGVFLYALLGHFSVNAGVRMLVALGYGLLTPAFAYAGAFYGHQLSAALLFGAFLLVASKKTLSTGNLLVVGLLLGYSVVSEYPSALLVVILFLYTFYRLHQTGEDARIGWVMLTGAMVAVGWMTYNNAIFGGPFNLGYSYSELWVKQHEEGFMSLTLPHWKAIWGITFGDFRGLFFLSPILLLALPGFALWRQQGTHRAEWWMAVSCVLAMFLFNSSSIMWWGGFAVGPRYMLPVFPFLCLPIAYALEAAKGRGWLKAGIVLLAGWSLVITWGVTLGGQSFPPDTIRDNPLRDYTLPHWQNGNIARNLGTIMRLPGARSLLPLFAALGVIAAGWSWGESKIENQKSKRED